jgi:hypothetical protein
LLAKSSNAIDVPDIPQISDYGVPAIAYTMISWMTTWSS